ncbi:MAG TPA: hypothetical protein VIJ96_01145, partial [Acidothermaceae bacterium]
ALATECPAEIGAALLARAGAADSACDAHPHTDASPTPIAIAIGAHRHRTLTRPLTMRASFHPDGLNADQRLGIGLQSTRQCEGCVIAARADVALAKLTTMCAG